MRWDKKNRSLGQTLIILWIRSTLKTRMCTLSRKNQAVFFQLLLSCLSKNQVRCIFKMYMSGLQESICELVM